MERKKTAHHLKWICGGKKSKLYLFLWEKAKLGFFHWSSSYMPASTRSFSMAKVLNKPVFSHTDQGRRCPGTRPAQRRVQCPRPSCRWRWGRRTRPPLEDWSGCCPTADPDPALHTATGTPSQSQTPLGTANSDGGEGMRGLLMVHITLTLFKITFVILYFYWLLVFF